MRALDRFHAYQLHTRGVDSVIRETFASSLGAATDTLEILGFTEGQALEMVEMFRKHHESLLQRSVSHMDDMDELLDIARQGLLELQQLFDQDKRNPMAT